MITMSVGELKPNFSEVLKNVVDGENVIISYGRKKKKVAVMVPYAKFIKNSKTKTKDASVINNDLDAYCGKWIQDEEFDKALKAFDKIDEEAWL